MKFLRFIIWLVSIVIILAVLAFWYLGGFKNLEPFEVAMGPHTVAYVAHEGDYKLMHKSMEEMYSVLEEAGVNLDMGIGIFYDDPDVVAKDDLKSDGGFIIDKEDFQKLDLNGDIYKVMNMDKKGYAVVTFPIKNTLSYFVGPQKAYPVLREYLEANEYDLEVPGIEIYDMKNNMIYYMAETK